MSKRKKNSLSEQIEITDKVVSVVNPDKEIPVKLINTPAPKKGIKLADSWGAKSK
jgi:hypothetical protein